MSNEIKDSRGVAYSKMPAPMPEQMPTALESQKKHPLQNMDDYNMLMQFFCNAIGEYQGLAARRKQDGDEEAYKYYAGMADGIRMCLRNIEAFKDRKFIDPLT